MVIKFVLNLEFIVVHLYETKWVDLETILLNLETKTQGMYKIKTYEKKLPKSLSEIPPKFIHLCTTKFMNTKESKISRDILTNNA